MFAAIKSFVASPCTTTPKPVLAAALVGASATLLTVAAGGLLYAVTKK